MQRLYDWLSRSSSITPTSSPKESIYRTILPGLAPAGLTNTIARLETLGPASPRPGATDPSSVAALRFLDTEGGSLRSALLAADLGAVIALASDRRVEVALEIPMRVDGRPPGERIYLPLGSVADRRARGPFESTLKSEFNDILGRVPSLSEADRDTLGAALQLHSVALILAEHDLRAAYVLVVAGLEVLSRAYGDPPTVWTEWEDGAKWDACLMRLGLTPEQSNGIRTELLQEKHLRLKLTFKSYVSKSLPAAFLMGKWVEWQYTVNVVAGQATWGPLTKTEQDMPRLVPNRETLAAALGRSYNLRSGIVHRGEEVELFTMALKANAPVQPNEPVPYSLLRQILRTLILVELRARSTWRQLPDIRLVEGSEGS